MYYTRTVPLRRMTSALVLAAYVTGVGAVTQAGRDRDWPEPLRAMATSAVRHLEQFTTTSEPPVDVTISASRPSRQIEQLVATTRAALALFDDWLGPFPLPSLTVVEVPWNSPWIGASYPGVVTTRTRRLAPERDVSAERILIGALARQYWTTAGRSADPSFQEGLVLYTGTRGIHELLGGRNSLTVSALGGFVSHPIRAIQLSPNLSQALPRLRHLDEVDLPETAPWRASTSAAGGDAERAALALHTLERVVGWPALQSALESLRRQAERPLSTDGLATILNEQRGADLRWFFSAVLAPDARFDYAVEQVASERVNGDGGMYRTVVTLGRRGNGIFAAAAGAGAAPALPVTTTFEDGTVITDYWDGRDQTFELRYTSRTRAVSAILDPSLMLLVDVDRSNNSYRAVVPIETVGTRLALHWLIWLQDLMLSGTALT